MQLILCVVYITALLVSNIVSARQCAFGFGIVLGGGIFVFPITYILSDVFSESYGYKWSRFTNWLSFAMNLFAVLFFTIVIKWDYPSYFLKSEAYNIVLGNTPRILIASLSAFILGDWANDIIFKWMKNKHKDSLKGFKSRAILSSVVGNAVDALVFHPIAFLGVMSLNTMIISVLASMIGKTLYEIVFLPVTCMIVKKVNKIEAN